MPESYRSSRRSDTPSSSSSGGSYRSSPSQYQPTTYPSGHSYYPSVPVSHGMSHAFQSPHQYSDSANLPRRSSGHGPANVAPHYPSSTGLVVPDVTSERVSKRPRATTGYSQWSDVRVNEYEHKTYASGSDRGSPGSSGYNSSGYTNGDPHDFYGQQPLVSVSRAQSDAYARRPSSDNNFVEHGPTELPPRTFSGKSPYNPPKQPGKIPGSAMDYLPILEARFDRLETAIDKYVDFRGQRALVNSILPGMDSSEGSYGRENMSSSSRNSRSSVRR